MGSDSRRDAHPRAPSVPAVLEGRSDEEHTMTTSVVDNGVNVAALLGAREAIADAPEIARFQWRSRVSWVNGTHSSAEVDTFHGFGEEQRHTRTFTFDVDHPPLLEIGRASCRE